MDKGTAQLEQVLESLPTWTIVHDGCDACRHAPRRGRHVLVRIGLRAKSRFVIHFKAECRLDRSHIRHDLIHSIRETFAHQEVLSGLLKPPDRAPGLKLPPT